MSAAPWIVLFLFGLIGLNWPFLEIFHEGLYPYLLIFWLLFVVLVAFASRRANPPPPPPPGE
jgi:hypothetical membrane protein